MTTAKHISTSLWNQTEKIRNRNDGKITKGYRIREHRGIEKSTLPCYEGKDGAGYSVWTGHRIETTRCCSLSAMHSSVPSQISLAFIEYNQKHI